MILMQIGVFAANAYDYDDVTVQEIIDARTLRVRINNSDETIRLIGVDCIDCTNMDIGDHDLTTQVLEFVHNKINGKSISVSLDPQLPGRDLEHRMLGYVYLDGMLLNELLVSEGFACTNSKYIFSFKQQLVAAQKNAQSAKKGMWRFDRKIVFPELQTTRIEPNLQSYTEPVIPQQTFESETQPTPGKEFPYIAYVYSSVFHHKDCPALKNVPVNHRRMFATIKAAQDAGFRPCHICILQAPESPKKATD